MRVYRNLQLEIWLFCFIFLIKLNLFAQNHQVNQFDLTRGLKDTVGFAFTKSQLVPIIELSKKLEAQFLRTNRPFLPATLKRPWIAGICPHDDHLLAGRVYIHLMKYLKAKRVILLGVFHRAKKWNVYDKLVFDEFQHWYGIYGPIKPSALREQLIAKLPKDMFIISNQMHAEEHSIEGILPWLQYYNRDAEIIPILVPYMNWPRLDEISKVLSEVLAQSIQQQQWILGEDLCFIYSNDCVHYGDQDWDNRNFAPFGTDEAGTIRAMQRDSTLLKTTLLDELSHLKLKSFCEQVWGENDITTYKITWCGRFAIPFGLNTVAYLTNQLNQPHLNGTLLRYGTSYTLGKLPLSDLGIGTTAPNNIHHWVGYCAVTYY